MTSYFESLMAETFRHEGESPERAKRLASAAMRDLAAVHIIQAKDLEAFEQDGKIDHLKAQGVKEAAICERLGITPRQLYRGVRRRLERRRAVLQARAETEAPVELGKVG